MLTHFDHVYSYLIGNDLDAQLARMKRAGFRLAESKVRHASGMLNGFVQLTGTYLELISIVDEAEFEREASRDDRLFRKYPQPFGVGAVCQDPAAMYLALAARYPTLQAPYSKAAKNDPESAPPIWTFCPLPRDATPGTDVFALKYLKRGPDAKYELRQGENAIFGLTGLVMCSRHPLERAAVWERTLSSIVPNFSRNDREIRFGVQRVEWITPEEFERRFEQPWRDHSATSPCGEIAAIRFGTSAPEITREWLSREGFVTRADGERLWTLYDEATGYRFSIDKGDTQTFCDGLNQNSQ